MGFRAQTGLEFRVQGAGFGVHSLGFRVPHKKIPWCSTAVRFSAVHAKALKESPVLLDRIDFMVRFRRLGSCYRI